jgi:MtrB/PioB family decaheme-associated outer membrane protein
MGTDKRLLCIAAAIPWFGAIPALAQEVAGEVEVGIGDNATDSLKFGEYSGLTDPMVFGIGNLFLYGRAPSDSDSSRHWEAVGTDLGLSSRFPHLEYGFQGQVSAYFEYDQIPHNQIEDGVTPYFGVGSNNLVLPPGIRRSATTSRTMPLADKLNAVEIETERTGVGGGSKWRLDDNWTLSGDHKHEFKDGTDTIAGVFGYNGGNPGAIILPMPIDFGHDTVEVALEYSGKQLQAQLAYSGSWFTNNDFGFRFDNPYAAQPGGAAWNAVPDQGQLSLVADNQAHRITLSAGYTIDDTTRLTGVFSYGLMLQDENFLPYTINPGLIVTTPLPRNSLDGRVDNFTVDLSGWTRPTPELELGARFRFDDRDNSTPRDLYLTASADTQNPAGIANDKARINLPYGYTQDLVSLDAT